MPPSSVISHPPKLGVPWLDAQHAHIVEMSRETLALDAADRHPVARPALLELLRHVAVHFGAEEELMRFVGYPLLAPHVKDHEHLLRRVEGLAQEHLEPGPLAEALTPLLTVWIARHIAQLDAQLAVFLERHPERLNAYLDQGGSQMLRASGEEWEAVDRTPNRGWESTTQTS